MGLFNRKNKVENACSYNGNCNMEKTEEKTSNIKILGGGCFKCNSLEKNVMEALKELNMTDTIEHVKDFSKIAAMGVMNTPALVIDNKVVSMGKVLSKEEALKIIHKIRG